jgi:hypothetical protein
LVLQIQPKEKVMLVFKTMRSRAVVALIAMGLAACTEGPTAPTGPAFDVSDALLARGHGGSGGTGAPGKASGVRTFTIWPAFGALEKFGDHTLYVPPNVICDPATSGYGAAHWDTPCARLRQPIQVTATWLTRNGRPVISFSPDLRFAPSDQERDWVKLTLKNSKDIKPELYYTILWFDKDANRWVDESQADPTLKAQTEVGNFVSRRLKHFSDWALWVGLGSYNVTSGLGGDPLGVGYW